MHKVVLTRSFPRSIPVSLEELLPHEHFDVVQPSEGGKFSREELLEELRGAHGLFAVGGGCDEGLRGKDFDAAPHLKVISRYGVGYDNVDVGEAADRGVRVTNTPNDVTDPTADTALILLLSSMRRASEFERTLRGGGWSSFNVLGHCPTGKVLGIIGMGRIGKAVATRAQAFGMQVIYHNRKRLSESEEAELHCSYRALDDLLHEADAISLHCPLTAETEYLINREQFAQMKRGAVLVNTSRGKVVCEEELVRALESGHLFGAGLDVFENEPSVHPRLLELPNVTLLPHIGSATVEARAAMAVTALSDLRAVLRPDLYGEAKHLVC